MASMCFCACMIQYKRDIGKPSSLWCWPNGIREEVERESDEIEIEIESPKTKTLHYIMKLPKPLFNTTLRCSSSSGSPPCTTSLHSGGGGGGRMVMRRAYDGLLLDAGGTLLQLANPVEHTYSTIAHKYGLSVTSAEIKKGFKRAFSAPWPEKLRYQGDGRPFWKLVVSEATGCANDDYFEEVYEYYANGDAWRLPPGAYETMVTLKDAGVKLAVVSNFDTRLRKLLKELNVVDLFDAVIISSEVGYEKPDAKIFEAALDQIDVEACKAVHIGDDQTADKSGAIAVGIDCWLWGTEVKTFSDIQKRVLLSEP